MKSLRESLLADMDDVLNSGDEAIKNNIIKQWLIENLKYGSSLCIISKKPNKDGKYEVSASGDIVFKDTISALTNEIFIWTNVSGNFNCSKCYELTTLEGAPEKVGGNFSCNHCTNLTSLEGAPKKVGKDFNCDWCIKLTSLEGAPKEVGGNFKCSDCIKLKTLEGAPKKVEINFYCGHCGKKFTKQEINKLCKVHGEIYTFF